MSRLMKTALALCLALVLGDGVMAEDYPSRRITLLTPYAPGASSDAMARVAAASLSERINQPVVVENKVGGSSVLATRAALAAAPDGYTLLFHTNAFHTTALSMPEAGYSVDDFVIVAAVGTTAYVLVAPSTVPSGSLESFTAYLKAQGARANYGSLGRGTQQMLLGERFKVAARIGWQEIPYKSGADVIAPLLTNQIQGFFGTTNFVKQQPLLKPIAITSNVRSRYLPDIPTFKELGHPELFEEGWFVVLAPARTPKPIIERLRAEFRQSIRSDKVRKQLETAMVEPYEGSIDEFVAYTQDGARRFAEDIRRFAGAQ
ncbi:tripartite tricarboxylate transporter substrate binding protein [Bradyrhizobium sp. LHD-71]|uniref:Bug family tripartite tricarboxylate transporter substrate binding protein n=1 Tax=Bradyrhizobium sp. LHD-71 TaxID=3072141 RepID=UPI00280DF4FC|nr:tripartite tricarboxylate transporter substrate binding protein [Bradyrhizobium sp. LHD-71]MDQ8728227.1 tripartite tricarboxylate transporter substrate binding protein [Bradyrhizobium sp. LHD-71]